MYSAQQLNAKAWRLENLYGGIIGDAEILKGFSVDNVIEVIETTAFEGAKIHVVVANKPGYPDKVFERILNAIEKFPFFVLDEVIEHVDVPNRAIWFRNGGFIEVAPNMTDVKPLVIS